MGATHSLTTLALDQVLNKYINDSPPCPHNEGSAVQIILLAVGEHPDYQYPR